MSALLACIAGFAFAVLLRALARPRVSFVVGYRCDACGKTHRHPAATATPGEVIPLPTPPQEWLVVGQRHACSMACYRALGGKDGAP